LAAIAFETPGIFVTSPRASLAASLAAASALELTRAAAAVIVASRFMRINEAEA
jgi:hypothetical protein